MKNKQQPIIKMGPIVIDCGINQAEVLSIFYSKLLGWEISHYAQNGTAAISSSAGNIIAFQEIQTYKPPVWPWEEDGQGQMLHFDLLVEDLDEAIQFALCCGAKMADKSFFDDSQTMLDPAGHTFCLDTIHS